MASIREVGDTATTINNALLSIENVKATLTTFMEQEAIYLDEIEELKLQSRRYERALRIQERENAQLRTDLEKTEKTKSDLENSIKGHRIAVLLDGDGAIFSAELISRGSNGGQEAAQLLSESILKYLETNYEMNQYEIWVKLFLNKRGLMDALGRTVGQAEKFKFEEFLLGFNQASDHFLVVDVGSMKEGADSKIKAYLEDDLKIPQTEKVIFGGCHDNGYVSSLRSQITNRYKSKIILLRCYTEVANGISELGLPEFSIPGLFMTEKLSNASNLNNGNHTDISHPPSPVILNKAVDTPLARESIIASPASQDDWTTVYVPRKSSTSSSSYSSAAASSQCQKVSPKLEAKTPQPIKLNPNFTLAQLKLKRAPCNNHYLNTTGCKRGSDCSYGHDYILSAEHYEELQNNARKAPCPYVNENSSCPWDSCFYGHYCPSAPNCYFLKQGICKFKGANMHKDPKGGKN